MIKSVITQVQYQNLRRRQTYIILSPLNTSLALVVLLSTAYALSHFFSTFMFVIAVPLLFVAPLVIEIVHRIKLNLVRRNHRLRSIDAPAWTLLEETLKDNLDFLRDLDASTQHHLLVLAAHDYRGSIRSLIQEVLKIKASRRAEIEHFVVRYPYQANLVVEVLISFTEAQFEILSSLDSSNYTTLEELIEITRALEC